MQKNFKKRYGIDLILSRDELNSMRWYNIEKQRF